jgi:hypothetical protein
VGLLRADVSGRIEFRDPLLGYGVAGQLVGHDALGRFPDSIEQATEESFGRIGLP